MSTIGCEPVQLLRRVMDGVEAPQDGNAMQRAMSPVINERSDQRQPDCLNDCRLIFQAHAQRFQPTESLGRQRAPPDEVHGEKQETVDEVAQKIGEPTLAEDSLGSSM